MINTGYDMIIDRIVNREVEPPKFENVRSMNAWLNGYARCQFEILELISELKEGSVQR